MTRFTFLTLSLLLPFFSFAQTAPTTLTKVGDFAPGFTFQIEKGKEMKLENYKGKIVLINFFATWCPPCRLELPLVQKQIWEKYKDNPHFALLVIGREETWDKVLAFKAADNYTFPILPDEQRKIYGLYATQTIPRNFLIDKDGKIIYQSTGYSEEEFGQMVKLLEEKLN